jgi:hypothetical protein
MKIITFICLCLIFTLHIVLVSSGRNNGPTTVQTTAQSTSINWIFPGCLATCQNKSKYF